MLQMSESFGELLDDLSLDFSLPPSPAMPDTLNDSVERNMYALFSSQSQSQKSQPKPVSSCASLPASERGARHLAPLLSSPCARVHVPESCSATATCPGAQTQIGALPVDSRYLRTERWLLQLTSDYDTPETAKIPHIMNDNNAQQKHVGKGKRKSLNCEDQSSKKLLALECLPSCRNVQTNISSFYGNYKLDATSESAFEKPIVKSSGSLRTVSTNVVCNGGRLVGTFQVLKGD